MEERKRAVWRVVIDNEMLMSEKLIIDFNEELATAGIQLVLFSAGPRDTANWLRSTRMFNKTITPELWQNNKAAEALRNRYGFQDRGGPLWTIW